MRDTVTPKGLCPTAQVMESFIQDCAMGKRYDGYLLRPNSNRTG